MTNLTASAPERRGFWAAVDERLGVSDLAYPVPPHANTLAYSLGGITLVLLVILFASGVLLAQWYDPMPADATQSVRDIMKVYPFSRIVRGVHFWGAQAAVLALLLHVARVMITGAYRRPREANWIVGVLLLSTMFFLYFTGTVLKWDQEAYEALVHNLELAERLGALGAWFSPSLSGVPMLIRLYMAHVSILPLILVVLVFLHVLLVKKHGISPRPGHEEADARLLAELKQGHGNGNEAGVAGRRAPRYPTFTQHAVKLLRYGCYAFGLLLILAVLVPPAVGPAPVEGVEVSKPPWAFTWLFALENWWGLAPLLWVPTVLGLLLLLTPWLDRARTNRIRHRMVLLASWGLVVVIAIGLGIYAYLSTPAAHVGD